MREQCVWLALVGWLQDVVVVVAKRRRHIHPNQARTHAQHMFCVHCAHRLESSSKRCPGCDERVCLPPPPLGAEHVVDDIDFAAAESPEARLSASQLFSPPGHFDAEYGFVERHRGEHLQTFQFYRESDGMFILAASMAVGGDGTLVVHTRKDITSEGTMEIVPRGTGDAGFVCALVNSNYLGTEFTMLSRRAIPKASKSETMSLRGGNMDPREDMGNGGWAAAVGPSAAVRKEVGILTYQAHIFTSMPFSLAATVRLNPFSADGTDAEDEAVSLKELMKRSLTVRVTEERSLFERFTRQSEMGYLAVGTDDSDELATFESKKPVWSPELASWTLDFNGRVPRSSKRNFILVPSRKDERDWGEDVMCLRFGKAAKHRFALDYRFPFSPVTALATACSVFVSKLAL
jgi:hypothetical protein